MTKAVNLPIGLRKKLHPLEAAGLWPYAPLTGPIAQGPPFPGEDDPMDYRQDSDGNWYKDPGWWRRLKK